jgi:hypothetical protein
MGELIAVGIGGMLFGATVQTINGEGIGNASASDWLWLVGALLLLVALILWYR